jgi:hypothetical protein
MNVDAETLGHVIAAAKSLREHAHLHLTTPGMHTRLVSLDQAVGILKDEMERKPMHENTYKGETVFAPGMEVEVWGSFAGMGIVGMRCIVQIDPDRTVGYTALREYQVDQTTAQQVGFTFYLPTRFLREYKPVAVLNVPQTDLEHDDGDYDRDDGWMSVGTDPKRQYEFLDAERKPNTLIQHILNDVERELCSAVSSHAPIHSAHEGYAVLLEEVRELEVEVFKNPKKHERRLREEAIQVAAMAIRFIHDVCDAEWCSEKRTP